MGGYVYRALAGDTDLHISHVVVPPDCIDDTRARLRGDAVVVGDVDHIGEQPDFALECAGHVAVAQVVPKLLRRGEDVIVASVGALGKAGVPELLETAARQGGRPEEATAEVQ